MTKVVGNVLAAQYILRDSFKLTMKYRKMEYEHAFHIEGT